jgi:sugar O-acyltransferase (sialic acid O-acetyltransferase NeuD family)
LSAGSAVILVGAGRFADEVTSIADDSGVAVRGWIEGIDESKATLGHVPPIVWVDNHLVFEPALQIAPAIGSPARRALMDRLVADGRTFAPPLIHPSAVVARTATIEPGCVIFPNTVIGARTTIGRGTIVNRGALIGHHTTIGSHAFIAPGANIAGGVTIGHETYIGLGAVIRDDRSIGRRTTVGAGAVVVQDVGDDLTVIGLPARAIRRE